MYDKLADPTGPRKEKVQGNKQQVFILYSSVLDPNTFNLDPDPVFGPVWIRIQVQGYLINF